MKKILLIAVLFLMSLATAVYAAKTKPADILKSMHWLGQAAFRIEAGKQVIYIDPVNIKKPVIAGIIFITHDHPDHLSAADLKKITGPDTMIIAPAVCLKKLKGYKVTVVEPGDAGEVKGIKYEAVAAYNDKHPKKDNYVGYVITVNNSRIYHAGDTGFIPEMLKLKNIAVACVPIGGFFTMDWKDAALAVNSIKPAIAVPIHYNNILGGPKAPGMFKSGVQKGIRVELMKIED